MELIYKRKLKIFVKEYQLMNFYKIKDINLKIRRKWLLFIYLEWDRTTQMNLKMEKYINNTFVLPIDFGRNGPRSIGGFV
jgi:hypothetical protein